MLCKENQDTQALLVQAGRILKLGQGAGFAGTKVRVKVKVDESKGKVRVVVPTLPHLILDSVTHSLLLTTSLPPSLSHTYIHSTHKAATHYSLILQDKRGVTCQFITLPRIDPSRLKGINHKMGRGRFCGAFAGGVGVPTLLPLSLLPLCAYLCVCVTSCGLSCCMLCG